MSEAFFPPTHHSAIHRARSADPDTRAQARETIVRIYWKPVYTYVRWRWKARPEDAEDLVQGFFTREFEKGFFSRYDPQRARFRTYLRVRLDGFVGNERRAAGRQKRGGGVPTLPLDFETAEGELRQRSIPDPIDPESLFEREWIRSLFTTALERLRAHCIDRGQEGRFRLFERYDIEGAGALERPTYRQLAEVFGIPETQVTNHLAAARRDLRRIVLEVLRELCSDEAEYQDECRALLGD